MDWKQNKYIGNKKKVNQRRPTFRRALSGGDIEGASRAAHPDWKGHPRLPVNSGAQKQIAKNLLFGVEGIDGATDVRSTGGD